LTLPCISDGLFGLATILDFSTISIFFASRQVELNYKMDGIIKLTSAITDPGCIRATNALKKIRIASQTSFVFFCGWSSWVGDDESKLH
jgi:hypothetical protein